MIAEFSSDTAAGERRGAASWACLLVGLTLP